MDDAVRLPDRFTARPLSLDDLNAVVELIAACEEAANGTPVEQVLARYLDSAKTPAA